MNAERPFSIVRRILATVVGVSLLSLVLHLVSLYLFLEPMADEVSVRMVSQFRTLESALRATPAAQRDGLAATLDSGAVALSRSPPVRVSPASVESRLPPPLLARLESSLGRGVTTWIAHDQADALKVAIDVPIDGEIWWLTLTSNRPLIAWTLIPLLASVALIGLAAGLMLYLGVRLITEPMSKLAEDMLARRNQLRRIDEPARLSVELQGVIRSFNALVSALELSDRSRHDLLAGISHDLRTPLARLRLRAETECPAEVADRMDADFIALSRIIDQFLAYAQGQNGIAVGAMCSLSELTGAVVDQYRADGLDVTFRRSGEFDSVVPDIGMQRVLANLIDNARSHGRAPVEVELEGDNDGLALMVFDRGAGIREDAFADVLKPFVRLEPEASSHGHCGLGLAIVTQVAEQLGGRPVLSPFDGRRSGIGVRLPA